MSINHSRLARMKSFRPHLETLEDRAVPAFVAPVISQGAFANVGDFDGNGKADLVVLDQDAGTVAVRLGNGDGTFSPAGPSFPTSGFQSAAADFDGDGRRDVLVGSAGGLALFRGNGDGTLQAPVGTGLPSLPVGYRQWLASFEVADMNNDGRPDVVARTSWSYSDRGGDSGSGDILTVMLAGKDGAFAVAGSIGLGWESRYKGHVESSTPKAAAYHLGDFDGDGKTDVLIVASAKATKKVTPYPSEILRGKGDGTFDVDHPIAQDWVNADLVVADLNGDGKSDLLERIDDTTWKVYVGSGAGVFSGAGKVTLPGTPAVADVNGDGIADLVAADSASGTASVLLGKNGKKFEAAHTFAVGSAGLTGMAVADANGDGRPDLVVTDGDRLFVLLNEGK